MSAMGTCPTRVSVRSGITRCWLRSSILASGRYFRSAGKFKRASIPLEMPSPSTRIPVQILHVAAESDRPAIFSVLHSTTFSARGEEQREVSKMKRAARQAFQGLESPVSRKGSRNSYFSSPLKTRNTCSYYSRLVSSMKTLTVNPKGRSADKPRGRNSKVTPSGQGSHMKRNDKKASKAAIFYVTNAVTFIGRGAEGEDACISTESTRSSTPASTVVGVVRSRSSRADVGFSVAAGRESNYIMKSNPSEFAAFEAHTTGFASRMMVKMGYVWGHGLGREKQGITQPVEAVKRPKLLGLGA
ncbi:hypothetical protein MPTK1_7g00840 [Marchantia polymorpha subsp. ruderalis]|uniref:G-patch domain-containing protein n=2 Tax=Marchantia polymorpha TaxID=3197 RepID=A0A176VE57_MARPO|nr:hypothetical protein AXG93_2062s1110 [Marchantia polymorpha subsp. ruderalis]PTQ39218.1 hypothetical protein MARPO_0046s0040 [Marchantia polymorpha]BBN15788.1 hypothetical protein Mp_7g00840 [Marchantia polymorpha subsp. ruderalis]|eukprot:PTQ39218.1 hypothetical protein MARPO_0046s0040 [Marchantia polymorpha]